jgi:DHA3 family tetracycline resistance protein-like MFS transporter
VIVALVALLAAAERLEIWHFYLASILFGLVDAFFQPAYSAVMPEVAPREALTSANSLTSLSAQTIGIVGPALGAAIIKLGGSPAVFAIDALTFGISAGCLLSIPPRPAPRATDQAPASVLADAREGLRAVVSIPWVWVWIGISTLLNVTWGAPMIVALPFLVTKTLGADVGGLGLVYSLMSLGAVAGAVAVGQLGRLKKRALFVCGSWLLAGLTLLALGWPVALWWVAACALIASASGAVNNVIGSVVMQEYIPAELLGRVSSIGALGSYALLPVGLGAIGWATDVIGAPLVFTIGGVLTAGLGVFGLSRSAMRTLD